MFQEFLIYLAEYFWLLSNLPTLQSPKPGDFSKKP